MIAAGVVLVLAALAVAFALAAYRLAKLVLIAEAAACIAPCESDAPNLGDRFWGRFRQTPGVSDL